MVSRLDSRFQNHRTPLSEVMNTSIRTFVSSSATIIISVYNNSTLLERALWGFAAQTRNDFQILIADDGSREEEVERVRKVASDLGLNLMHIWHADNGFRKAKILNEAIVHAETERLIFVDADMIPRSDFVKNHIERLLPNYFIAGGSHLNLPVSMHSDITQEIVASGQLFTLDWLKQHKINKGKFFSRLIWQTDAAKALDVLFTRKRSFTGCNASCWKKDALAINGFDEDWGYGGTDREFGFRLANAKVKSKRFQFSLIALHQDHKRPYRDAATMKANKKALSHRAWSGMTRIEQGIDSRSPQDSKILYRTNVSGSSLHGG